MKARKSIIVTAIIGTVLMLLPFSLFASGGRPAAAEEEPLEIVLMGLGPTDDGTGPTWCMEQLNEIFDVKFRFNGIADHYDAPDKYRVMLATGDFPNAGLPNDSPQVFYRDKVIRGIPEDMIVKYMPNYTRRFKVENPLGWLRDRNPDNENEFLALQRWDSFSTTGSRYLGFRYHWAKAAGFELPDYESKKVPIENTGRVFFYEEDFIDLDWLTRLLVAFRDGDLDGNGKDDTIPWGAYKLWDHSWEPIAGAFGFAGSSGFGWGYNLMVDGELLMWNISPQYKDFLKFLAGWWKQGLIDSEFMLLEQDQWRDKMKAGFTGAISAAVSYAQSPKWQPGNMIKDEEVGTGKEVVIVKPPLGPTGKRGAPVHSPTEGIESGCVIGAQTTDEQLAKILQALDYVIYTDDIDVWLMATRGEIGVNVEWTGEPYKSQVVPKEGWDWPKLKAITLRFSGLWYEPEWGLYLGFPKNTAAFLIDYTIKGPGKDFLIYPYRWDVLGETQLAMVNDKYGAALETIRDEFFFDAILGEIDIDAEWDSYVSKWRESGGDEFLAELKKAPISSEFRKGKFVY